MIACSLSLMPAHPDTWYKLSTVCQFRDPSVSLMLPGFPESLTKLSTHTKVRRQKSLLINSKPVIDWSVHSSYKWTQAITCLVYPCHKWWQSGHCIPHTSTIVAMPSRFNHLPLDWISVIKADNDEHMASLLYFYENTNHVRAAIWNESVETTWDAWSLRNI